MQSELPCANELIYTKPLCAFASHGSCTHICFINISIWLWRLFTVYKYHNCDNISDEVLVCLLLRQTWCLRCSICIWYLQNWYNASNVFHNKNWNNILYSLHISKTLIRMLEFHKPWADSSLVLRKWITSCESFVVIHGLIYDRPIFVNSLGTL